MGYLFAGMLIGPYTPGFVADNSIANELAEIGVMLLMFGVGLHFSLRDLMLVRNIAIPGALVQIFVAALLGTLVAYSWGFNAGGALVFGVCLSVASTVVLLRALEANNLLESMSAKIAVGWLLVEDLMMVVTIVLLPPLALWLNSENGSIKFDLFKHLGLTLVEVSTFIILMLVVGRKLFPKLLWKIAYTGSRELFTLCVISTAITIAFLAAKLFGVSFALGAFFAGMMMRESPLSHRAAEESLPLREAFSVLFFVSVGMLFDPSILIDHPGRVLVVVAIVVLGKTFAAAALVLFFRYPVNTALLVSVGLAQIGEFSFILAELGVRLKLLSEDGQSLILAAAIISIALNPLLFRLIKPIYSWLNSNKYIKSKIAFTENALASLPVTTEQKFLEDHVVLIGYGQIGWRIGKELSKKGIPFVVAEQNRGTVEELRIYKIAAVFGDASEPEVLVQAHVARAKILVIAIQDIFNIRQMIQTARLVNPKIEIYVSVANDEHAELIKSSADKIFISEHELANSITNQVINLYNADQYKL